MPVFVPLLDSSGFRFHERAHPDLVSLFHSDLSERTRVAGATDGGRGLALRRQDNCFPWIEDFARAQQRMSVQLRIKWPKHWDQIAEQLNPMHPEIFRRFQVHYYGTTHQSEWASDIVFREAVVLRRLYPLLLHPAVTNFGSPEVLRFLGRKARLDGQVPRNFRGEL